jgi:hypothetical protein
MAWYNQPIQPLDPVVVSATPKPPFRYLRDNFMNTGQNSFENPPAQDQQMWQSLENVMPILNGSLEQRWGYDLFTALINSANRLYDFQSDSLNTRAILATGLTNVAAFNENGTSYNANVFTPEAKTGIVRSLTSRNYQYFYDGDNATDTIHRTGDSLKWNGSSSGGVTNWGINVLDVTANEASGGTSNNSIGPTGGNAVVDDLDRANPWTNVSNVLADDGATASCVMVSSINPITHHIIELKPVTDTFNVTNFFSAISGSGVVGLQVSIKRQSTMGGEFGTPEVTYSAQLIKNGTLYGQIKSFVDTGSTGSLITTTLGSATDLWGGSFTISDLIASNFGVAVWASWNLGGVDQNGNGSATSQIDYVAITAYIKGGTGSSSTSGDGVGIQSFNSGAITLTLGRTYYLAAFNSLTGHFSDLTVASTSTGAATNEEFTLLLATFNDPQVDTKYVLATADGGDPSILYEVPVLQGPTITAWVISGDVVTFTVPNTFVAGQQVTVGGFTHGNYMNGMTFTVLASGLTTSHFSATYVHGNDSATEFGLAGNVTIAIPNATTTVIDNTPDPTLVLEQILLFTDQFGNEFGVTQNTPPPSGTLAIKHQGRLWMTGVPGSTHSIFFSKSVTELTLPDGFIAGKYEEAWPGDNYFDVSDGAESVSGLLTDGQTLYIGTQNHIRRLLGSDPTSFIEPQIVHPNTGLLNQEVWSLVFQQGAPSGCVWMTPDFRVMQSDFNTYVDIGTPIQDILNNLQSTAASLAHASFVADGEFELYILAVPYTSSTLCDTHLVFDMRNRQWFVWTPANGSLALLYNVSAQGVPQWLFIGGGGVNIYQYLETDTTDNGETIPMSAKTVWLHMGEPTRRKVLNELEIYGDPTMSISIYGANKTQDFAAGGTPVVYNRNVVTSPFGNYKLYLTGEVSKHQYYQLTFTTNDVSTVFLDRYALLAMPLDDI